MNKIGEFKKHILELERMFEKTKGSHIKFSIEEVIKYQAQAQEVLSLIKICEIKAPLTVQFITFIVSIDLDLYKGCA